MIVKLCLLIALFGACYSRPDSPPSYGYQPSPQQEGPAQYNFNWAVKDDYSGNDFGQEEQRDGYDTQGSYYVLLPDERRQLVTYNVNGDSGFIADVQYEGEARYSEPQPSYNSRSKRSLKLRPRPSHKRRPQPSYKPRPQHSHRPKHRPSHH